MKKALIFGIGGFVGEYLAKELSENGYNVTGSDIAEKVIPNTQFLKADLLNQADVENVVFSVNPDIIINLAAISSVGVSWKTPQTAVSVNVIGAVNILEASRKFVPNAKIMFVGSSEEYINSSEPIDEEVYLNANNPYGISKIAQEQFAKIYREQYGMRIYCVRPFNHTGVGQKDTFVLPSFCKQVAEIEKSGKDGVIKVGNLAAKRDFSDVRDVVRAYRIILENGNCEDIFNVGSGKVYTLSELLKYIISLSSQKIEIEIDESRFRPTDTPVICCDYKKIKRTLGWEPRYSIFDTLKEMFCYYLNREG